MNPGRACITCHSTMNGPSLTIAGTVYPSAHEPDLCNGANGTNGARVVITGADGQTLTLTPGTSGNFNSRTAVKTPFKAKVTYMGRERAMAAIADVGRLQQLPHADRREQRAGPNPPTVSAGKTR